MSSADVAPPLASETPSEALTVCVPEAVRILFVDDEPLILEGIRRNLHEVPEGWTLEFAAGPIEALALIERGPVQVVVSDMQMPHMSGAALLARIAEQQPDCVRLVLTGQADLATAAQAVNEGHIFRLLFKPCDRRQLMRNLEQAVRQFHLQTAERDLLRSRLEHAQRLAVVGEFTAGVMHDVKNLLAVVMHMAQERDLFEPEHAMDMIGDAAKRAVELTGELMGFSRRDGEEGNEPLELIQVLRGSAVLLRPMLAHEHHLDLVLPDGEVWVNAHAGRMRQVVSNLVINARDASPRHATIIIEVGLDAVPTATKSRRPFVRLTVRDEGCGIDEATRARLFEPFFTTKTEGRGTGLGLALVQQLVGRMQGVVEVESAPGAGAAFHVFVPAVDLRRGA